MTRHEARHKGFPPGFALRLDAHQGDAIYLADHRRAKFVTTVYPSSSEWFGRLIDAAEMARRLTFVTGQKWIACTIPDNPAVEWEPPAPLLTEQDAFNAAVEHFLMEEDGDRLDALTNALEVVLIDGRRYGLPGNGRGVDRG